MEKKRFESQWEAFPNHSDKILGIFEWILATCRFSDESVASTSVISFSVVEIADSQTTLRKSFQTFLDIFPLSPQQIPGNFSKMTLQHKTHSEFL